MFGLNEGYAYWDDVNEGITRNLPLASKGQKALDVGCGRAALGAAISAKGYEVWGVENAPAATAVAKARVHRLLDADLMDLDRVKVLVGENRFDVLVFSDVLEHVYDPVAVLKSYAAFLRPGALVLISVPNSVVWIHRLEYLLGKFQYRDSGVLDRTHIRFFTFKSAQELLVRAGVKPVGRDCTPYLVRAFLPWIKAVLFRSKGAQAAADPTALLRSPAYQFYLRWFYPVEYGLCRVFKGLLSFRIITIGRAQ